MSRALVFIRGMFVAALAFLFCLAPASRATAQAGPSLSVRWDYSPYQNFEDPIAGLADAEVHIQQLNATLTWPIVFSEGRTVWVNQFSYRRLHANYRNWPEELNGEPEDEPEIDVLHAAQYTLMLQRRLSRGWSAWALATPGLASDLEAEISWDDFNFEAAVILIRHFSERFSLGFGAAYSTAFGEGLPLPVLAFEWNNGSNLRASAIVPTNAEFWYQAASRIALGILLKVDGNEYHGDPELYQVDDPRLRYSVITAGPSVAVHLSRWAKMKVDGGIIGLHRSEFFDGDDREASYDLKPGPFLRVGVELSR